MIATTILTKETEQQLSSTSKVKLDSLLNLTGQHNGQKAFFLKYDKQSFREYQEQRNLVLSQIEESQLANAAKHS